MKRLGMLLPLAALTVAFAQPQPGMPGPPAFDNIKSYLGLTDSTIQTIQQTLQRSQSTIQPLVQQMGAKHKVVGDLLAAGSTDATAIGKAILEAEALKKQIGTQHDALRSSVLSLLTADQKTKLKALEDASKLAPTIQEAMGLQLLDRPAGVGPGGPGGPGMFGGPGGPGPGPGMGQGMMRGRAPRN